MLRFSAPSATTTQPIRKAKGTHTVTNWKLITIALVLAFGVTGCVNREAQKQGARTEKIQQDPIIPVRVQPVSTDSIVDSLEITGDLTTSDDVIVGAKVPGKIVAVFKKDGDPVAAGEVIAKQDTINYQLQTRQAQAAVRAAQAQLRQAASNAIVGPSRSSAALSSAQAQLRSVRAQLKKALNGARDEDRVQAQNNVNAAKSNLETVKSNMERMRKLFQDGAISKSQLDAVENQYQAALSQYENSLQAQKVIQNYARPEDLESARESVRQAEEGVRSAQAQKKLDVLLDQQVQAAKANVEAAQAQLALAKQAISDAEIRSPFSGKISGKPAQVGAFVGAGSPIAHIIGVDGAYFEGEVSETALAKIKVGNPVDVTIDAFSGKKLSGTISAISPQGDKVGRLFKVRIQIIGNTEGLQPGMFARGSVIMKTLSGVKVIPKNAIVQRGKESFVFIVNGDKAKMVKVVEGLSKDGSVQVDGINVGDQLVVSGQDSLSDGSTIRIAKDESDSSSSGDSAQ